VTYVVRSRIMGYPDAISIRLHEDGDVTRVDIFSRSRHRRVRHGRERRPRGVAGSTPLPLDSAS
jgi:hypothetical protein